MVHPPTGMPMVSLLALSMKHGNIYVQLLQFFSARTSLFFLIIYLFIYFYFIF